MADSGDLPAQCCDLTHPDLFCARVLPDEGSTHRPHFFTGSGDDLNRFTDTAGPSDTDDYSQAFTDRVSHPDLDGCSRDFTDDTLSQQDTDDCTLTFTDTDDYSNLFSDAISQTDTDFSLQTFTDNIRIPNRDDQSSALTGTTGHTDAGSCSHTCTVTVHRPDTFTDPALYPNAYDHTFTDGNGHTQTIQATVHHTDSNDCPNIFTENGDYPYSSTDTLNSHISTDIDDHTTRETVCILHTNKDTQLETSKEVTHLHAQSPAVIDSSRYQSQFISRKHPLIDAQHGLNHPHHSIIDANNYHRPLDGITDTSDEDCRQPEATTDSSQHKEQITDDEEDLPPSISDTDEMEQHEEPPTIRLSERKVSEASDGDVVQDEVPRRLSFIKAAPRRQLSHNVMFGRRLSHDVTLKRKFSHDITLRRNLSQDALLTRQRSQEELLTRQRSQDAILTLGRQAPREGTTDRLLPPLRRLSDLRNLTLTLGLQIHGSFLNLATEKSRKQSDQMVSLSFKSLESYISEDNLTGLQTFLATRTVVIDDRDENGATALIVAASKGKPEFCNQFLLHGADVNIEDNDQWSPIITAAKEGHVETVATLLDHGANIHHRELGGWTAVMWACYKGHTALVKMLLARGADPNTQGQHHMTSLVWAAGRGHTEIVHDLLEHGAKVNIGDKFGTTPLIWACRKGFYEIARDLLQHGANVDASGMYSWTPLLVATRGNYVDLVHLLLEHRPNLNALDKDGGTALTIACKEGYTEIANALLNSGAYVNMQDRNSDTNLIYAARGGHRAVVESLLKKYCDVDMVGKERKTALYWAVEKGHTAVVKVLLSANPDLEHTTKEGDTCLLRAVRNKNAEVVQLLVDKKTRVSVADKKGDTVLHIAMRGRSKRIVEILLRNPKNSQLLYRPNRAGETPYNIDLSNQKTILGQIFGARRLNTNEDNENMLGYDLYSSSMADILSEPSLSMPISVGLYAKWGSGKSFLIRKLKEEMGSFARQWVEPLFQFSPLVLLLVVHLSLLLGLITAVPTFSWAVGVAVGGGIFVSLTLFLVVVWHGSRRYEWHLWYRWSVSLERQMAAFKLVLQVIFCSPPGSQWKEWKDGVHARPLKFIFAEGAKPSSTAAGENSVVQMLGSLFDMVEREYGLFATRFYRAFRPKAQGLSAPWKYRRLCGVPYIFIFFVTLICLLTVGVIAGLFGFHPETPVEAEERQQLNGAESIGNFHEEEDDDDDDDDVSGESSEESEYIDLRPYHGALMNPLLITLGVLAAVVVVANLHTLARMVGSLIFSHRRHLLRAVSKLDTIKAEGYLQTLKNEVNLMVEMVKCLDAFTAQQTRLVVVVDGLDSCEQEKVLSVLDAVHTLFTDSSAPFIILLAIDPHIITKAVVASRQQKVQRDHRPMAIELHVHRVFSESSISGHDYLRNIVHLPFYLQNSGLRKVKQAQQAAERMRGRSQNTWLEVETDSVSIATTSAMGGISHIPLNRCLSTESGCNFTIPANRRMSSESGLSSSQNLRRNNSKSSRRTLKPSDSIASSIGSNLNRVGGAQDLTKVLLTDDYFSDINPRSMRRLMNVVYITGRLLKAFHIDFNWYHLASWINITEQWPYRASWLILYYEANEDTLEDKTSLKDLFEKIKSQVPVSKDIEPLLEMDKEEKKFEIFLSMHKSSLHISDLKVFLPFTINLDPFIRKVIKEDQPQFDDNGPQFTAHTPNPWTFQPYDAQSKSSSTARRLPLRGNQKNSTASLPPMNPMLWGYGPTFMPSIQSAPSVDFNTVPMNVNAAITSGHTSLPPEAADKKLSTLTIESLFDIFSKVEGVSATMISNYKDRFVEHNINGKVLLHCDLDDLKKVLNMNFGDWELFRMLVLGLRDREADEDFISKNVRFADPQMQQCGSHVPEDMLDDSAEPSSLASSMEGSLMRRGSSRASSTHSSNKDREDSHSTVRKLTKQNLLAKQQGAPRKPSQSSVKSRDDGNDDNTDEGNTHNLLEEDVVSNFIIPKIVIEQVTMEEQLIFGALQTLNEEACEDVLEEQEKRSDQPPTPTHLATIPSGESSEGGGRVVGNDEVDVMYLQSSPLVSHRVVSAPVSDAESAAPSLASSFSPYKSNNASLSRASSLRCSSTSTSPKHSAVERPQGISQNVSFRTEKSLKSFEHREASPIRRISLSNSSSPLRRDRPQSLNLGGGIRDRTASSPVSPQTDQLLNDEVPLASLPDLPEAVAGMKHVSLAEQFSSTSLEKLRRIKHKLHRALGSHDGAIRDSSDDAETSPLVLATPPYSCTTPTHTPPTLTPDVENAHPLNHCMDTSSHPITPLLRQDALETSPTSQITCKLPSVDRETPV
ncbi:kinase D-interacting substrate of 220 kDa B-like isoform X3 [Homarus americanus]|uniref:kinase D-interacting substrate of 220 kDa B-like isoform X3 n=1 Tax=Homarus americanus TaxID=6706 RepID=UPI001C45957E|nr:kinase D-interacting substrate of 220 kDa B-like isoform X3 [Homarus americanus]